MFEISFLLAMRLNNQMYDHFLDGKFYDDPIGRRLTKESKLT